MQEVVRPSAPEVGGLVSGKVDALVLATSSASVLETLKSVGYAPQHVLPVDAGSPPIAVELPSAYALRMARERAAAAIRATADREDLQGAWILAVATVVAVGRRILPEARTREEAERCLVLLSGRQHRVYAAVRVTLPGGRARERVVESRVRFKRLADRKLLDYLASDQWKGMPGAYDLRGIAGAFAISVTGSHSAITGIPLYETKSLLEGEGFRPASVDHRGEALAAS